MIDNLQAEKDLDLTPEQLNEMVMHTSKTSAQATPDMHGNSYGYQDFLEDMYAIMAEQLETTPRYTLIPNEIILGDDFTRVISYGISNKLLWVVPLNGAEYTYVEISSKEVVATLVDMYARAYVKTLTNVNLDVELNKTKSELQQNHTERVVKSLVALKELATTPPSPFGICSVVTGNMVDIDGTFALNLGVSLLDMITVMRRSNVRITGLTYSQLRPFYFTHGGYLTGGLDGFRVAGYGDALIVNGLVVVQ